MDRSMYLVVATTCVITATFLSGWLFAQDCEFDLGPDTMLCHGQTVLLQGPTGALTIEWQNGVSAVYMTADTSGTYWCTATLPIPGQDVVTNGDFSDGDTGFATDLQLGAGGAWGVLSLEGTYGVTTDPQLLHSNFSSCGDHTGGGGMFLANGSAVENASVWCQTITVQPNMTYAFSAWLMSASPESPAILDFTVNGASLGDPLLASSTTCIWDQFYALWSSGTATTVDICITNQNLATSGNDFALDDIAFTPLCSYTDSIDIAVLPPPPDMLVTGAEPICPGTLLTLQATLDPPDWPLDDVHIEWNTGVDASTILVGSPGLYEATAEGLCLNVSGSALVEADTCTTLLEMPNVFTPNSDGHNDTFRPMTIGEPTSYTMEIRNRWGQVVFRSQSIHTGWDGRAQGGPAPDGTYFWVVLYSDLQDNGRSVSKELSGSVTLLGTR
ncbi:MAG: gliding motility-associated C-terminal domain-containing protein [Flavobacteriales bacterium]|nr:gliding motility-associated C-terminal domain-containing protein [Flavobacteriales bacterium]